jgi:hypothetical protein
VAQSESKASRCLLCFGTAYQAVAQDATAPDPNMAPIDQYLMTDQVGETTLARSEAPGSLSRDAEALVLERHGFEKAVKGKKRFRLLGGLLHLILTLGIEKVRAQWVLMRLGRTLLLCTHHPNY